MSVQQPICEHTHARTHKITGATKDVVIELMRAENASAFMRMWDTVGYFPYKYTHNLCI